MSGDKVLSHPIAPGKTSGAAPAVIDSANDAKKRRIDRNDKCLCSPRFIYNMNQGADLTTHFT